MRMPNTLIGAAAAMAICAVPQPTEDFYVGSSQPQPIHRRGQFKKNVTTKKAKKHTKRPTKHR